jgi:hypothetical protein
VRAAGGRHESSLADSGEVFSDQAPATAILGRYLHHARTVNTTGDS